MTDGVSARLLPCPVCGRVYLTRYDGTPRRHVCLAPPSPIARTVTLRSGGTLTLNVSRPVETLDPRGRGLVCWLLDQFDAYDGQKDAP